MKAIRKRLFPSAALSCLALSLSCSQVRLSASESYHDLGSATVGSGILSFATVEFELPVQSFPTIVSLRIGKEFRVQDSNCSNQDSGKCFVKVAFGPSGAGLRMDAILISDSYQNILATVTVYGYGLSTQATFVAINAKVEDNASSKLKSGRPLLSGLESPTAVAVDWSGAVYVADAINQTIRSIAPKTHAITEITRIVQHPVSLAVDAIGNLYIADSDTNAIYRLDTFTKKLTRIDYYHGLNANENRFSSSLAASPYLHCPGGLAIGPTGTLYVSDKCNGTVIAVEQGGVLAIVAGGGKDIGGGSLGDGGPATEAILNSPTGLALSRNGDIVVADTGHNAIRVVHSGSGLITTLAGVGIAGYSGDLGPATAASLDAPRSIFLDARGDLFVLDYGNKVIREIDSDSGVIKTIVANQSLDGAEDIAFDGSGNLYVAESGSHEVRQLGFGFRPLEKFEELLEHRQYQILNTGNIPFKLINGQMRFEAGAKSGTGSSLAAAEITLLPNTVRFVQENRNNSASSETIHLTNVSDGPIVLKEISLRGKDAKSFTVSTDCAGSVPAASGCALTVGFNPERSGKYEALLTLHSSGMYTIPLTALVNMAEQK